MNQDGVWLRRAVISMAVAAVILLITVAVAVVLQARQAANTLERLDRLTDTLADQSGLLDQAILEAGVEADGAAQARREADQARARLLSIAEAIADTVGANVMTPQIVLPQQAPPTVIVPPAPVQPPAPLPSPTEDPDDHTVPPVPDRGPPPPTDVCLLDICIDLPLDGPG